MLLLLRARYLPGGGAVVHLGWICRVAASIRTWPRDLTIGQWRGTNVKALLLVSRSIEMNVPWGRMHRLRSWRVFWHLRSIVVKIGTRIPNISGYRLLRHELDRVTLIQGCRTLFEGHRHG